MAERDLTAVEQIIQIKRLDSPDDADAFDEDWVMRVCSLLGMTPDEYLAELEQIAALDWSPKEYPSDMPEWVKIKFGKTTDDKGGY